MKRTVFMLALALALMPGCKDNPTKPSGRSVRVWVTQDGIAPYMDAWLIRDTDTEASLHVARGETKFFRGLAVGVRYSISMAWPDSTGALSGTARHILIAASDVGEDSYGLSATGFEGTPDQW
jgi:hypothetical protein